MDVTIHYSAFKILSPITGEARLLLVRLAATQKGGPFQKELLTRMRRAHAANARNLGVRRSDNALEQDVSAVGVYIIQEAGTVDAALEQA